ncbi:MAG: MATE family efflux transporter [Lachnospiraceae bacterium]|nr:MATE family efflux transporter [Lachnospiraceae bacterium]
MMNFTKQLSKVSKDNLLFDGKTLKALLIPLIIEQVLNSLMGVADTMMVSRVGSASISAVSNVDQINVLVIQLFSALATGAAIICSQYLGRNDEEKAGEAAEQVVLTVGFISLVFSIMCMVFCKPLLHLIYGNVAQDVMDASIIYFFITSMSFPFLALFAAGSAFFRAAGNAKYPMRISVISNIMNIAGNAVLIFVFDMGVAGAAISTLVSRMFCMIVIFYKLKRDEENQVIKLKKMFIVKPKFVLIATLLSVGIPAGIENGMFQFGKLAIQSSVATLSTDQMAAQAMTIMLEGLTSMIGIGVGIGMMTVVGQAIGAGRIEEARYYIIRLTIYAEAGVTGLSLVIMALTKPITMLAGMNDYTADLCIKMMLAITIVKPLVWTLSFIPAYGLRAAGDVRFSMIVSMITMWTLRVAICIYLIRFRGFGPIAVWIAMFTDWTVRGIVFLIRFKSGKWHSHELI